MDTSCWALRMICNGDPSPSGKSLQLMSKLLGKILLLSVLKPSLSVKFAVILPVVFFDSYVYLFFIWILFTFRMCSERFWAWFLEEDFDLMSCFGQSLKLNSSVFEPARPPVLPIFSMLLPWLLFWLFPPLLLIPPIWLIIYCELSRILMGEKFLLMRETFRA